MRVPRSLSLPPGSIFHLMWRAIDGALFLKSDEAKGQYLDRLFRFFGICQGAVSLYAFCVLSNHSHEAAELQGDHSPLSAWLRSAHSSIGHWLNTMLKRRGPVSQDRPKTVLVQGQEHLKRLMFYIDWNPVRAGLCKHPSEYPFSSYRFYAFGEINRWSKHITRPKWYLELGASDEDRQRAYRIQCDSYFYGEMLPSENEADDGIMIGSPKDIADFGVIMRTITRVMTKKLLTGLELGILVSHALRPAVWEPETAARAEATDVLRQLSVLESCHRNVRPGRTQASHQVAVEPG